MTIAVIGTRGFPGVQGGVEMHSQWLYTHITRLDPSIKVRVYRRRPYLTEQSTTTFPGIEYVDLPSTRIKGFEAMFHTLLCVLHILVHRPTMVHVHNIGPGLFTPLLRLMRLPVVLTYHSPNYEHSKWNAFSRFMLRLGEWLSLRCSNRVIFVNKFQMEKCASVAGHKSTYIPNGIEAATPVTETSFLERHGIVPGQYVLAVGRLTPEKGFEYLAEAVNHLPQVKQLVIAGAADHDRAYLNRVLARDIEHKIVLTGFTLTHDLSQLYSHARLFVLSSVNEGFPLVMLEAMNYGLPMVVTAIPATHLVTLPDANRAVPASASSLTDAIERALANDAKRVRYDLSAFDWDTIARQTLRLFTEI